ncbi:MAG: TIGR03118 family protein [Deltaproteobacteria bacterium]|nr:TIGR03118 family protein [Deltaproteobacteria bacterium]
MTDDPLIKPALVTDSRLRNAWGITFGPTSPFWVSGNAAAIATLYNVAPANDATTINATSVIIPGAGTITGQVFSGTANFGSSRFIFVSEDGLISGWTGQPETTANVILAAANPANVYKGVTLATVGVDDYLYAANFRTGTIDVIKGVPTAPDLTGNFIDPGIPAGFAPFNIQLLGGKLYVAYALQNPNLFDDVRGPGNGFVSVFDTNGNFLNRVASQGTLNSPWGLAIAPFSFGQFAGKLLVGNSGDGTINAFDLGTNTFVGQLMDDRGVPITVSDLKALTIGNNAAAGSTQRVYFAAGNQGGLHGVFGVLVPTNAGYLPVIFKNAVKP